MAFHVFVEGAVDPSPDALRRLAAAMAQRYGITEADLLARLSKGRFRVKANIDQATANTYARDLGAIGARVTIEPAQPTQPVPAQRSAATSLPPATKMTPPAGVLRAGSSLPPANTSKTSQPLASGLAAAFSQELPVQADLGALGTDGGLSLASLDGRDDAPAAGSFEPPGTFAASIGPAPEAAPVPAKQPGKPAAGGKSARPERPKDIPLDLFVPPEVAAEEELALELAADELEHRARKSVPPASKPAAAPGPASPVLQRKSAPSIQLPHASVVPAPAPPMPRARFAAGVVLALVVGFVPAHFLAGMWESDRFAQIDREVEAHQSQIANEDALASLDSYRAAQLDKKQSARTSIALKASAIWAVLAAAVAFVWFRAITWNKNVAS